MANLPIKQLRATGETLGRAGMAEMALTFMSECDGSYKATMELCGKLSLIAKMATCDDYWHEQVERGVSRAEFKIEAINISPKIVASKPRGNFTEVTCRCGTKFKARPADIRRGWGKSCSKSCAQLFTKANH